MDIISFHKLVDDCHRQYVRKSHNLPSLKFIDSTDSTFSIVFIWPKSFTMMTPAFEAGVIIDEYKESNPIVPGCRTSFNQHLPGPSIVIGIGSG